MLTIRAERANVSRRLMDQTMPNHLVLPLEALSPFASRAALYGTVMWSCRRVDVCVRIEEILRLEWRRIAALKRTKEAAERLVGHVVDTHAIRDARRGGRC